MTCSIVPPHILTNIAERHTDTVVRERVRAAIALDAEHRDVRRGRRTGRVHPVTAPAGAEPERTIYTAGHAQHLPGEKRRVEGDGPTGDAAVDQSYAWLGITFEFYLAAYQRNSIDGAGLGLISTVHYGQGYDNAFWNGDQMVYGDGDGHVFLPFTRSLDVTGHELTHGVTQYTADLTYQGQSGALNESVSDVFGSLIKQYHLGQTADQGDWLIGADLLAPGVQGVALRSMKAPGTAYDDDVLGTDPQPATMADYVDTTDDNGGVHINSGIPNHAFYLAATSIGGHAWQKAGRIWYATLTGGQLPATADFAAFAARTVTTAGELFTDTEAEAVRGAWSGVGVTV